MSKLTAKKKLLLIIGIVIAIPIVGVLSLILYIKIIDLNPYRGKELALRPLPASYKLADVKWVTGEDGSPTECHPPIKDLPTTIPNRPVYYCSQNRTSPDKKKVAFIDSYNDSDHEIIVWDVKSQTTTPITSLTEADPGSGLSFEYYWSSDSKLLRITGQAYKIGEIDYIYDHNKKELYNVQEAK